MGHLDALSRAVPPRLHTPWHDQFWSDPRAKHFVMIVVLRSRESQDTLPPRVWLELFMSMAYGLVA